MELWQQIQPALLSFLTAVLTAAGAYVVQWLRTKAKLEQAALVSKVMDDAVQGIEEQSSHSTQIRGDMKKSIATATAKADQRIPNTLVTALAIDAAVGRLRERRRRSISPVPMPAVKPPPQLPR